MKSKKQGSIFVCFAALMLFVVPIYGHLVFNQIEIVYLPIPDGPKDGEEILVDINAHIVNSATNLLKSTGKFQGVLSHIESNTPRVDFEYLNQQIGITIEYLETARSEYEALVEKIKNTPQNPWFIQRLIGFNYTAFRESRKPNGAIYQDVIGYLQNGDANGILIRGLENTREILTKLYEIKASFNMGEIPFQGLYRCNENFYSAVLFGQYTAEICRGILKE